MPAYIDRPIDRIDTPRVDVFGWIASQAAKPDVRVRANGRDVTHSFHERPGLRSVVGPFDTVLGVHATFDLRGMPPARDVEIELGCDGASAVRVCIVDEDLRQKMVNEDALRRAAQAKCREILVCAHCRSGDALRIETGAISCEACGSTYGQPFRAINAISDTLKISSRVIDTSNVSSNPYTAEVRDLIARVGREDGWVLDCGAGFRDLRTPNVVNVEIVDYASTDVLAVGEALPFADDSFDAAISLAVLEHVRDPFACAKELLRVVKPGGEIIAVVPFLQPLHGFPNHFYNMTRAGLTNLFSEGGEILQVDTPSYGHPIFAAKWFATEYLKGLPDDVRDAVGGMTLQEIADLHVVKFLQTPAATTLSAAAVETLACGNRVRVSKRPGAVAR